MKGVEGSPQTFEQLFDEWRRRRAIEGESVNLMDLYDLFAESRAERPEELPLELRHELAARALTVIWPGFEQVAPPRLGDHVEIAAYDPRWASAFEQWRDRLALALGATATRIEHIGSTSVVGLAAKPIIDIQLSVVDLDDERGYVPGCVAAGFELYSRDTAHRFFHVPPPSARVAQLHVCQSGGSFERDHLLFRDYLRSNPHERDEYAAHKKSAAEKWEGDRVGYTYAKGRFILGRLDRANQWSIARGWSVGSD
jgi:GrpB-like predicted nucleotidyltransferase (UPF0157 family)